MASSIDTWVQKHILKSNVRISLAVFLYSAIIAVILTIGCECWNLNFFENVLVEAWGMLFDIIMIGGIILYLQERGQRLITIQRYKDEIDDFRLWESDEAAYRIRGNIKRLNREGLKGLKGDRQIMLDRFIFYW